MQAALCSTGLDTTCRITRREEEQEEIARWGRGGRVCACVGLEVSVLTYKSAAL